MDMTAPLVLDLPPETLSALRKGAREAGVSPSQHALRLLAKSLIRDAAKTVRPEQVDRYERPRADGGVLASLRSHLAPHFAFAFSWDSLQQRLSKAEYTLRKSGDDLALYSTTTATRICLVSDLGTNYADLAKLFDEPFPKHFHIPVPKRRPSSNGPKPQEHPSLFPVPDDPLFEDDDDIILFEDE